MIEIIYIIPLAFIMEIIDSSLGMMYGTILSPLLIGFGYDPLLVIPAILLSQAIGGIVGTFTHHKFGNANFKGLTQHTKVVLAIVVPGLLFAAIGVFLAVSIPTIALKIYIGSLVIIMGILCLIKFSYKFKWWKIYIVGVVSAFNKAISGGGFGPVTSTGKILGGVDSKVSVATTTYAEVPICLFAFILYVWLNGMPDVNFLLYLSIGAVAGGLVGPYISSKLRSNLLRELVGLLAIIVGVWILIKLVPAISTWVLLPLAIGAIAIHFNFKIKRLNKGKVSEEFKEIRKAV